MTTQLDERIATQAVRIHAIEVEAIKLRQERDRTKRANAELAESVSVLKSEVALLQSELDGAGADATAMLAAEREAHGKVQARISGALGTWHGSWVDAVIATISEAKTRGYDPANGKSTTTG